MAPRLQARTAGILYLLTLAAGIFAQGFVSNRLIVWSDPATTAANVLAQRRLFEIGFTVYMVEMACQMVLTVLLYQLLKPVNRTVSLTATGIALAGCTIKTFSRVFYISPLFVLGGAHGLTVFSPEQLKALTLLLLRINDDGAGVAVFFFGLAALLRGFLIARSTFLPRVLGVLAMLSGLGLLSFVLPDLGRQLFSYTAPVAFLGAVVLAFWFLVFGVDERRWWESAREQSAPPSVPQ